MRESRATLVLGLLVTPSDFVAWRLRSAHWRRRGLFTQHGSK
jgi:hypothetical protein